MLADVAGTHVVLTLAMPGLSDSFERGLLRLDSFTYLRRRCYRSLSFTEKRCYIIWFINQYRSLT